MTMLILLIDSMCSWTDSFARLESRDKGSIGSRIFLSSKKIHYLSILYLDLQVKNLSSYRFHVFSQSILIADIQMKFYVLKQNIPHFKFVLNAIGNCVHSFRMKYQLNFFMFWSIKMLHDTHAHTHWNEK